jgi:hypothetical protein
MKIAIGMCVLLLAASTTTVAAQGNEGMIATSSDWAMATTPIPRLPACFDPFGLKPYHPAPPALLDDGAHLGTTACPHSARLNRVLPSEERALLCDPAEDALEGKLTQARPVAAYSYPPSLDWRRKEGQDWTTPIREASSCGSCVAFAVTGAIESRLKIAAGEPSLTLDLSEAHLFFGSCDRCCKGGMTVDPALDFSRDTGIVDEACYPYAPEDQPFRPCAGWQSRTTAIAAWTLVTEPENMKLALAEGGPIVATLTLYEDFRDYTGGIYQRERGKFAGTHAVTLVGYDDTEGYWIGKNSWGTDWGEDKDGNPGGGGWFRIYYGQAGIDAFAYVPLLSVDGAGNNSMDLAFETSKRLHGSPR